jgi:site-specific recombinase XerD
VFRHTAASQMVNQGVSFKDVADVLGHRSLQTTGIYANSPFAVEKVPTLNLHEVL